MLFSYRKADPADANLLFFLTDFNVKKKNGLKSSLNTSYVMGTQGGKKKSRILEDEDNLKVDTDENMFN